MSKSSAMCLSFVQASVLRVSNCLAFNELVEKEILGEKLKRKIFFYEGETSKRRQIFM